MTLGSNLDLLCIWQLNAALFCENYAKPYFDAKHLEKRLNKGVVKFLVLFFFFKKGPFLASVGHCPNFPD